MGFFGKSKKELALEEYGRLADNLIANPREDGPKILEEYRNSAGLDLLSTRKVLKTKFENVIDKFLTDDAMIDVGEYQEILWTMITLGLDANNCEDLVRIINCKHALWKIKVKELYPKHNGSIDFMPKKNETIYYGVPAILRKHKTKTQRINYGGFTSSIRIMKGLSYRTGSLNYETRKVEYIDDVDTGNFYLTDKRVLFVGGKKNFSYPYDKIINVTWADEGLIIQKENLANPQIVYASFPETEVIVAIMNRKFNE